MNAITFLPSILQGGQLLLDNESNLVNLSFVGHALLLNQNVNTIFEYNTHNLF